MDNTDKRIRVVISRGEFANSYRYFTTIEEAKNAVLDERSKPQVGWFSLPVPFKPTVSIELKISEFWVKYSDKRSTKKIK